MQSVQEPLRQFLQRPKEAIQRFCGEQRCQEETQYHQCNGRDTGVTLHQRCIPGRKAEIPNRAVQHINLETALSGTSKELLEARQADKLFHEQKEGRADQCSAELPEETQ